MGPLLYPRADEHKPFAEREVVCVEAGRMWIGTGILLTDPNAGRWRPASADFVAGFVAGASAPAVVLEHVKGL